MDGAGLGHGRARAPFPGTATANSDNNFTDIKTALAAHLDSAKIPKARRKRYISQNDMIAILDYHNQVRGKVFPPASNMEYMPVEYVPSAWYRNPAPGVSEEHGQINSGIMSLSEN
ncbi:hypothetical protein TURU_151997 [Turdus rufiventris]|nr:hypothetical protein TURU_151997 [Turdus rufiventris]